MARYEEPSKRFFFEAENLAKFPLYARVRSEVEVSYAPLAAAVDPGRMAQVAGR